MRKLLFLGLLLLACLSGCASWETTRRELVKPLDKLLHRDYPRILRSEGLEASLELHGAEVREQARRELQALLAPMKEILHSRCVIVTVRPGEADGEWIANCKLSLDGVDAEGRRRTTRQAQELTCARDEKGAWRIVARVGEPLEDLRQEGPVFEEESGVRGLVFTSRSRGVSNHRGQKTTYFGGSGLTPVDVDDDGLDDLLLVGGDDVRLFHNRGGTFRDETKARGLVTPAEGECRAGYFADIDGDGDLDLFLGMVEADDALYINDGKGQFERADARARGLRPTGQTTSACFADFDGDGDLDLYVVNGMNLLLREPEPIYDAQNGTVNHFYRNKGDGTFEEVGEELGVDDPRWGLACTTSDFDRDGDVDLFLANDFGLDRLYRNEGDGTFEEVAEDLGVNISNPTMSATFGDLDGDGLGDLLGSGMASNSRWILETPGFPARAPWPINVIIRGLILESMSAMLHGNRVYRGRPDGTFEEVSEAWGLRDQEWGWAAQLFDYDNDGDLDVYGVNGFWSGEEPDDL